MSCFEVTVHCLFGAAATQLQAWLNNDASDQVLARQFHFVKDLASLASALPNFDGPDKEQLNGLEEGCRASLNRMSRGANFFGFPRGFVPYTTLKDLSDRMSIMLGLATTVEKQVEVFLDDIASQAAVKEALDDKMKATGDDLDSKKLTLLTLDSDIAGDSLKCSLLQVFSSSPCCCHVYISLCVCLCTRSPLVSPTVFHSLLRLALKCSSSEFRDDLDDKQATIDTEWGGDEEHGIPGIRDLSQEFTDAIVKWEPEPPDQRELLLQLGQTFVTDGWAAAYFELKLADQQSGNSPEQVLGKLLSGQVS